MAAIAMTGCKESKNDPQPQPQDGVIQVTHQLGERVKNPTNAGWCKAPKAEQTLLSLRRISDRLYYMDFVTDLTLQKLVEARLRTNKAVCEMMNELWFYPDGYEDPFDEENPNQTPACSGFVCFNEAGELLFGRNFDGAGGPMCMVFNTANGTHDYVQLTAPNYNSALYNGPANELPNGDGILSDDTTSLHRLLRQPVATMDGMNEHGLCMAIYQLPNTQDGKMKDYESLTPRPISVDQQTGKEQLTFSSINYMILAKCKTVEDVEELFKSHDFTVLMSNENIHWIVADAKNDWRILEYWNRYNKETDTWKDTLYIYDEWSRIEETHTAGIPVPYERFSIENYYINKEACLTYGADVWQYGFSNKTRVQNMMAHYQPTMTEEAALECLQYGNFGMELPGQLTDWSCVYNPRKGTVIFNMRDDLSEVYSIDIKKELAN